MRVAFLTGSLEPGKDGVGDYTRALASECVRQGATCQIIALADPHVGRPVMMRAAAGAEHAEDVEMVRLPAAMAWAARLEATERAMRWLAPNWVSVQFVPFSYHRWGIATALVRALPRLVEPARLHVMLHEIWIGSEGSLRRRLVAQAQRHSVRRLCRREGTVVHTSNRPYQLLLASQRIPSNVLPLFGNIAIAPTDAMTWLAPQLANVGCNLVENRNGWWVFVLFGTIHPRWSPEPLFGMLQVAAAAAGKRIAIVSAGRLNGGDREWHLLCQRYASIVPMLRVGEQPDARISELLNTADFGIATSPYALLDKSGTAVAMLEHGLPVVVSREDGFATAPELSQTHRGQIIRLDSEFAARLTRAHRVAQGSGRVAVAATFLADLNRAAGTARPARADVPDVA